jgi:hypothetical protein
MGHDQFEHAIAALAREHHHVAHATKSGGTGDRGLDVLVQLHNRDRILIQCKHYAPGRNNVSGPDVREIVGSVIAHQCQYGIIVTTSDFTAEAYDTNRGLGRNALTLINGDRLAAWANGGPRPGTDQMPKHRRPHTGAMTETDRMVVWLRETLDAAEGAATKAAALCGCHPPAPHWSFRDGDGPTDGRILG